MIKFTKEHLKQLWRPNEDSSGEDNGQITIIGGSELFQGAPLLSLIAASRLVDMVFLATPETDKNIPDKIAAFSKLRSFIWVPREEIDKYIEKSDAVLIGPGMMRYDSENTNNQAPISKQVTNSNNNNVFDNAGTETKRLTEYLLHKWPEKQWVVDGGALQVLDKKYIPKNAILTPNQKEYEMLFAETPTKIQDTNLISENAKKFNCIIVHKGPVSFVTDGETTYEIDGGNAGLTKGGTGDVLAGVTLGLVAKNPPLLAAAAASFIVKKTAEYLYEQVEYNFNADDVAENVFKVWKNM